MSTSPPVIPEIAKAYQNDPRTLMALAAMKQGASTTPVATGNNGYADGIARVLQGLTGAYMNKQAEGKYGDDQSALLALRQARGVDGLTGTGTPTPTLVPPPGGPQIPAPPGGPPAISGGDPSQGASMAPPAAPPPVTMDPTAQSAAIASALGSPAPQAPPMGGGPPGMPMAPIPPQAPPGAPMAPANGGGPMGRPPFGPSGMQAPNLSVLGAEVVPDAPGAVARPVSPGAVAATRSPMLAAAYRVMSDANPYESANGQDMLASGLEAQGKMNESAAERQQKLTDLGYQSDLGNYADAQQQDRGAQYAARTAAQGRNFTADQSSIQRNFEHGEKGLDRNNAITLENLRAKGAIDVEKLKADAVENATPALDPATLQQMAQQAWAGDKSVFSGLGRGAGGARNIIALRKAVNDMGVATGKTGADLASMNAQFAGATRAAAAAGQRVGAAQVSVSELPRLTSLSSEAYGKLPRGQFVPFNSLQRMVSNNTSSPEQAAAYAADFAVINAYARALSPTGQPHEADKKRATEMLNGAYSQQGHEAVLNQINTETQAIKAGAEEALRGPGTAPTSTPVGSNAPLSAAEKAELLALRRKYKG